MALNNNLVASWNFDTVTGSNGSGEFQVLDVSDSYNGKAAGFSANSHEFILKEDLKSGRKLHFETIEGEDTIQIVDIDDERISPLKKPSSVKLMVENSMYQIISDEMLNLFSTVDRYAFRFTLPDNKYKYEYDRLIELRKQFFDNIQDKPDLEKYIEFYKWIDSSLGALIDQLKPENSSDFSGLKTTVESHILEREKYEHQLPLTIQPNRVYTNADNSVTVIKKVDGASNLYTKSANTNSPAALYISDEISDIVDATNVADKNFAKNHEVVQTAGRYVNNRGTKTNKTVFRTNFSAGDGLSELNRDASGEYSIYNENNQRARDVRDAYNLAESQLTRSQGTASVNGDFRDNQFVQRAVPYTDTHYTSTSSVSYQITPNTETEFRQRSNVLIDDSVRENAVIEPPIEFTIPAKQTAKVKGAFESIDVSSPYSTQIDTFSPRTLQLTGNKAYFDRPAERGSPNDTFFNKSTELNASGVLDITRTEILENIYPRKDLMGMAQTRTKPNYEEIKGVFNTGSRLWSQNSYNNNTADIRSFWRDNVDDRKRTRGSDNPSGSYTGSINVLGFANLSSSFNGIFRSASAFGFYSSSYAPFTSSYYFLFASGLFDLSSFKQGSNPYNSIYGMDSLANDSIYITSSYVIPAFHSKYYGDLAPLPHSKLVNFLTSGFEQPTPKPQFVHNVFPSFTVAISGSLLKPTFINNLSYQNGLDPQIKPWYDTYQDYFENIKHKSSNASIVPEYAVSFNSGTLRGNYSSSADSYLKILGRENFKQLDEIDEYFIADFNKFIDENTNKIKISLSATKKLLPYNGFYPNQFSLQIVKEFSDAYLSSAQLDARETQAIIQPLFGPGILFNTIKSGLAVAHPVYLEDKNANVKFGDLYEQNYFGYSTNAGTPYDLNMQVVKYLGDKLYRLPFEAIIKPRTEFFNNYLNSSSFYLDPTHYSDIFTKNVSTSSFLIPSCSLEKIYNQNISSNLLPYELCINNFLAETVKFFLDKGQLTSFVSEPDGKFYFEAGKTYGMNVKIKKNKNFSMFKKVTADSNILPIHSLFGPPVSTRDPGFFTPDNNNIFSEIAYYPYVPHYLKSDLSGNLAYNSPLQITFTPTTSSFYSISQIHNSLEINNNFPFSTSFIPCLEIQSSITESLNLTQIIPDKQISFDSITTSPSQTINQDRNRWVIQTKFESPLIDYDDTADITLSDVSGGLLQYYDNNSNSYFTTASVVNNYLEGIWSAYGNIPKDGQSVQISIDDAGFQNSLLKAVGFKKETKSIGRLANNKLISEAIVMIPYVKGTTHRELYLNKQENKRFFVISENIINNLLKIPNYRTLPIEKIKTILETSTTIDKNNSIVDLMLKMVNYNIPPHLNWLFDTSITPFVMYIADFNHTLDKQDLADIWQGNMPQIAKVPEEQTVTIEHGLYENELMGGYNLNDYDIKLKVFKIKKRAANNYFDLTADVSDNKDYKYEPNTSDIPWYTYNWPYDYFSLVELVNIQAGGVYEKGNDATTVVEELGVQNALTLANSPLVGTNFGNAVLRALTGSNR